MEQRKQLLIVDDTKIDRLVLKSILDTEYEILEASNGNIAFEYLTTRREQIDAVLLDLSMPHIDGFDILKFMKEKGMEDIPVFIITAEPTRTNVEKAINYHVDEFIGKPFDREDFLWRLRSRLGIVPNYDLSKEDVKQTKKYIADLEAFYKNYLTNFGKSDKHYETMVDLMRILLNTYAKSKRGIKLTENNIDFISKAAYFCDIGEILIPDKKLQIMSGNIDTKTLAQNHTIYGSNLIMLNRAKSCSYFVEVCSSMCLHHHERYDGTGYPYGIKGKNNSFYNQLCAVVDYFDNKRSVFYGNNTKAVKFVIKNLVEGNNELASKEVYSLLANSEEMIVDYFLKQNFKQN